ncbi:MAG: hypothetical protein JSV77_10915 [Dehalococcoidales bacterium]|nr:MAG: hypothetical protein JSV77_10915 [Dehalococcoidales bacterium]
MTEPSLDIGKICPECGRLNPSAATMCDCGYDFDTGKVLKVKKHTWLVLIMRIIIAAAGLFLGIGGWGLWSCEQTYGGGGGEGYLAVALTGAAMFVAASLGLRRLKLIATAALAVLQKALKYLWATKLRRVGSVIVVSLLIVVISIVSWQSNYQPSPWLRHYDGNTWNTMRITDSLSRHFPNSIWGLSSSDVFSVGFLFSNYDKAHILHYNGQTWKAMEGPYTDELNDVWGSSISNVYAVGIGTILHYNGLKWSRVTVEYISYYGIWGSSSSDIFVTGSRDGREGVIVHYDGSGWSEVVSTTNAYYLEGIWGTSASDVYAVGANGTILHYNGIDWNTMTNGTNINLSDIWGTSTSDIYAVGDNGTILHYDGLYWSEMNSGTQSSLYGIWGSSASDVFTVGEQGTILHYDGSLWSEMKHDGMGRLRDVWGSSSSDVFVVK